MSMVKQGIYSLFDNTSLTYEGLYVFPNDDTAIRNLRYSIKNIPFPEDKDIMFVGFFDTTEGLIVFDPDLVASIGRLVPEVPNDIK